MTSCCIFCNGTECYPFCLKGFLLCCLNLIFFTASLCRRRKWATGLLSLSTLILAFVPKCRFMTETAWVSSTTLSICFPRKAFSHFPLNAGFLSFLTLGCCSSLHDLVSDSEDSSCHRLLNMNSCRCLQCGITGLPFVWNSFLVVQSQSSLTLNRILQIWLV